MIFVAEVASTCNESLLMQHLLKKTTEKKARAALINYFLEQFRTTLYRQTMFAEFELWCSQQVQQGMPLTAQVLNQKYGQLNQEYYGDAIVPDPEISLEWARIPHFYRNFYVYQYATGFSAAIAQMCIRDRAGRGRQPDRIRCGLHGGSRLLPPGRPGEPLPQPGASLNKRPLPAWQRPFVFQGHCAPGPFLVYWDKHLSRRRDMR